MLGVELHELTTVASSSWTFWLQHGDIDSDDAG